MIDRLILIIIIIQVEIAKFCRLVAVHEQQRIAILFDCEDQLMEIAFQDEKRELQKLDRYLLSQSHLSIVLMNQLHSSDMLH
jgi:hypothetical protein